MRSRGEIQLLHVSRIRKTRRTLALDSIASLAAVKYAADPWIGNDEALDDMH
jgi:hypothetical protein